MAADLHARGGPQAIAEPPWPTTVRPETVVGNGEWLSKL
jgi:hypothetical protein